MTSPPTSIGKVFQFSTYPATQNSQNSAATTTTCLYSPIQPFRETPQQRLLITMQHCSLCPRTAMTPHPLHTGSRPPQRPLQSSNQNTKLPKQHRIQNSRQQTSRHSTTNKATCSDSRFLKKPTNSRFASSNYSSS